MYNKYKNFLDEMASPEEKKEMQRIKEDKRQKREQLEKQKAQQEKLMKQQMSKNPATKQVTGKKGDKSRGNDQKNNQDNLEADLNIPPELKEIIEDSDDDLPLRFENPSDLMDIFTNLEEKNLFLISRCQEAEH